MARSRTQVNKKRVVFLTGTRADYGKLKPLMEGLEKEHSIQAYIFATGMHMSNKYGATVNEIKRAGFKNIHTYSNDAHNGDMAHTLAKTIDGFSAYVKKIKPDLIIVHGDRIEALAGALVGAVNNVRVGHVEGGEISGTLDEHIRHAVSKLSHAHFVANNEAKKRLIQMGERADTIFVIGSPDIDVMLSSLPTLRHVQKHYEIPFNEYGVVLYHPVVTELDSLEDHVSTFADALIASGKNYVVIYPNNDPGTDVILEVYRKKLIKNPRFKVFPSMRFEHFLSLIKHSKGLVGNSSAGIREAPFYGIPSINVGSRQDGRAQKKSPSIKHVPHDYDTLLTQILRLFNSSRIYKPTHHFGRGNSRDRFIQICRSNALWDMVVQKKFIDLQY